MKNTTVKARLAWTFGWLACMVLLVAGLAVDMLVESSALFEGYVSGIDARALAAARVRAAIDQRAIAARNLVLVSGQADMASELQIVEKAHADATQALAELERLATASDVPDQVKEMIEGISSVERRYAPVALDIVDLAVKGQREEAVRKLNETCRPLRRRSTRAAYRGRRARRGCPT